MTRFAAIILLSVSFPAPATAQDADALASVRAEFTAAYRAATLGEPLPAPSDALRAYPIYRYIDAARLERELLTATGDFGATDRAAEAFVSDHPDEPVSRRVLGGWLDSLARRGLDRALVERYEPGAAGTALECRYLSARIALGDTRGVGEAVRRRWLTGAQLPTECEPVFRRGRESGLIDADLIARRIELLLENGHTGFARVIARQLPEGQADRYTRWAALLDEPAAAFDALTASPDESPGMTAVQAAWARFARNRPEAAAPRLTPLIDALEPGREEAGELHRALALGLAWDRNADALGHFAAVPREQMDDYTLEWQTRAALWSGAWPTALDSIDAMSDVQRDESAWRYWHGRAADALGDDDVAKADWHAVLDDDNFYSAVAAARLGQTHRPAHAPLDIDEADLAALDSRPPFVRARELHAVGLENDARREWNTGYDALPATLRRASIRLAARWQWHEIAILTATRNGVFYDYDLLYPQQFTEFVPVAADLAAFDRNLLYGLIRQESLFTPDAVSSAGAIGLTQLQLETAQRAAAKRSLERPSRNALFDPQTNITLGAAQLRNLLDEFDGQIMPSLAGYNAGYNAAARWLPDDEIDADIWVENIPYNETRAYVRRVLWHSLVYAWLETGRAQDASGWLTPVRRPSGNAP